MQQHGLEVDPTHRLIDLVSEVGELAGDMLKRAGYGARFFEAGASWEDEMGDVCMTLVRLANSTGIDIEQALGKALAKYEARIRSHGRVSSQD